MKVGDKVFDDLTKDICTVTNLLHNGCKLDNELYDGYRFIWEVQELTE